MCYTCDTLFVDNFTESVLLIDVSCCSALFPRLLFSVVYSLLELLTLFAFICTYVIRDE